MSLNLFRSLGVLLVTVAALFAGQSSHAESQSSPFAGSWVGSWSNSNGQAGTFDITISQTGVIEGIAVNNVSGFVGTMHGHVKDGGSHNGSLVVFPYGANPFNGSMSIDANGNLTGDWVFVTSGITGVFDLARK